MKKDEIKEPESVLFQNLTPRNDIENGIYDKALKKALLPTENIFNVAVSGSYGSGKSSVIQSFEKVFCTKHKKFLYISLASFNEPETKKEKSEETDSSNNKYKPNYNEQLIEQSLLQQIFYHVHSSKVPDTRFERINTIKPIKLLWLVTSIIVWFNSALITFQIDFNSKSAFYKLVKLGNQKLILWSSFVITILGIAWGIKKLIRFINGLKLNKLNLKNGEIEINYPREESILNRYLDEIIYFFETNKKYKAVIIEDLDRFNDLQIFTKLREINLLINRSEILTNQKRKVVFIYALCDNLFANKDRTKFFDLIIPTIPIINTSNSSDVLSKRLKEIGAENDIKREFVYDIQLYVDDMRMLFNITNEYIIYKDKIGKDLDPTRLFAMIVFKNLYPEEFVLLHTSQGFVFDILDKEREKFISISITDLKEKRESLGKKIDSLENTLARNESELRVYYAGYIWSKLDDPHYISGNRFFNDFIREEVYKSIKQEKNKFRYYNKDGNNLRSPKTIEEFEKELDPNFSLEERLKILNDNKDKEVNRYRDELEKNRKELLGIRNRTIKELSVEFEIDDAYPVLAEKKNHLVRYLIRNGYINEDYPFYLSYFYEGSLTSSDREFLLTIKNGKEKELDYPLKEVKSIADRIYGNQYLTSNVLNVTLLKFLLEQEISYQNQLDLYIRQLGFNNSRSTELIKLYPELGDLKEKFFKLLFKKCKKIWLLIQENDAYDSKIKDDLFLMMFRYANFDDIITQDLEQEVSMAVSERVDILSFITTDCNSNFINFIDKEGISFKQINKPVTNKPLFKFIDENWHYQLSPNNVEVIFSEINNSIEFSSKLNERNYTTILESNCHNLREYIEAYINEYIENVFLKLEENKNDKEEYVIGLLNNTEIQEKNKIEIIKKWEGKISLIINIIGDNIKQKLLEYSKVEPFWSNVQLYIEGLETIDDSLAIFLNEKHNSEILSSNLKETSSDKAYDELILKIVTCNKLNEFTFDKYISQIDKSFEDLNIEVLDRNKISVLIKYKRLNLSVDNYKSINKKDKSLLLPYIEGHKDEFIDTFLDFDLDDQTLNEVLESKVFFDDEKLTLVGNLSISEIPIDFKISNKIIELAYLDPNALSPDLLRIVFKNGNENLGKIFLITEMLEQDIIRFNLLDELLDCTEEPYNELIKLSYKKLKLKNNSINIELIRLLKEKEYISSFDVKDDKIIVNRRRV